MSEEAAPVGGVAHARSMALGGRAASLNKPGPKSRDTMRRRGPHRTRPRRARESPARGSRRCRRAPARGHRLLGHGAQGRSGDPHRRGQPRSGPARLRGTPHGQRPHERSLGPRPRRARGPGRRAGARHRRGRCRRPSRRVPAPGAPRPRSLRSGPRPPSPPRIGSTWPAAPRRRPLAAPGITNSFGASYGSGETLLVLANTRGFSGSYRRTSVSLSTVPVAERDGAMERDQWYSGRVLSRRSRGPGRGGPHRRRAHAPTAGRPQDPHLRGPGRVRPRDRRRSCWERSSTRSPATRSSATRPS